MKYGRVVIVKGIEQGTTPAPDFKSEEKILRLILQQEDTVYTADNMPHVTQACINVPWEDAASIRVGQRIFLSVEVLEAVEEKVPSLFSRIKVITGEA